MKNIIITIVIITIVAILGSDILARLMLLMSSGNGVLG
jgi:hypothetical protein